MTALKMRGSIPPELAKEFSGLESARVVIAEDSQRDFQVLQRAFEELGYRKFHFTTNIAKALQFLEHDGREILVANIQPGSIDVITTLLKFKSEKIGESLPVILTLNTDNDRAVELANRIGADGYFSKPIYASTQITGAMRGIAQRRLDSHLAAMSREIEEVRKFSYPLEKEHAKIQSIRKEYLARLESVKNAFPWFAQGFTELGRLMIEAGDGSKAMMVLFHATSLDHNSVEPLILLADFMADRGFMDRAIYCLKQADDIDKSNRQVLRRLGDFQLRAGLYNDSIITLNRLVNLLRTQPESGGQGKRSLARGLHLRGTAFRTKGVAENSKQFLSRAAADFKESASIDPDFFAALYNLMVTYKQLGENDKAKEIFDQLKTREPQDFEGWLALADAYDHEGDRGKLELALYRASKIEPENLDNRKTVIAACIRFEMLDKADQLLAQTIRSVPNDVTLLNKMGIVRRRQGSFDAAIEIFRQAIDIDPWDPVLHFNLGRAYFDKGELTDSKKMFEKALQIEPELKEAELFLQKLGA